MNGAMFACPPHSLTACAGTRSYHLRDDYLRYSNVMF